MSFWKHFEKRAAEDDPTHPFRSWDNLDRTEHVMDLEDKRGRLLHKEHMPEINESGSKEELEKVFQTRSFPREEYYKKYPDFFTRHPILATSVAGATVGNLAAVLFGEPKEKFLDHMKMHGKAALAGAGIGAAGMLGMAAARLRHEKQASECEKYKYLYKKHEARETFDQENDESEKEQKLEEELGVEKQAINLEAGPTGVVGGVASGYYSGRSAAGTTANALSQHGSKTRNEETARNLARVTGPLAAVGGIALGYKHRDKLLQLARKHISNHPDMEMLYHGAIPFGAGTLGGMAGGAATGAAMSLRGHREKRADDRKHNVLVGAAGGALGGATGALVSGHGSAKTLKQHLVHTGKGAAGGALVGAGALALHNWRKHHQKHAVKKIDYDTYEHTPRLSLTGAALGGAAGHAASHYLGLKGTVPRTLARYVLTASAALDGATAVDTLRGIRHKQFVEHGKKHGYMPKMAFYEGFAKEASKLTTKARNALSSDAFVFPQERRYPLNNLNHARNALARSSGKPEEAKVRAAVYSRYPELKS